jgi:hypothetical protein
MAADSIRLNSGVGEFRFERVIPVSRKGLGGENCLRFGESEISTVSPTF